MRKAHNSKLKIQNSKRLIARSAHLLFHVRLYLGVLVVGVNRHSEDAPCVNQALGEQSQHAFVNLAQRRYDESCHRSAIPSASIPSAEPT